MSERYCDYCKQQIQPGSQGYALKIEMYALPDPPEFSFKDLQADHSAELEELIQKMESLDPQEAQDQVHESYPFILCSRCRNQLHRRLKGRQFESRN